MSAHEQYPQLNPYTPESLRSDADSFRKRCLESAAVALGSGAIAFAHPETGLPFAVVAGTALGASMGCAFASVMETRKAARLEEQKLASIERARELVENVHRQH